MNNPTKYWQAQIIITQAPTIIKYREKNEKEMHEPDFEPLKKSRSFIYNPFANSPHRTYGLELIAKEKIELNFFTRARSRNEALEFGEAWLANLRNDFIGLDGLVKVEPILKHIYIEKEDYNIEEIILPDGPIRNDIKIIERFNNAFYFKKNSGVHLIIMWRRNMYHKSGIDADPEGYNMRLFILYNLKDFTTKEKARLRGILRFLYMDIEDRKGERAMINPISDLSYYKIMLGDVFNYEITSYDFILGDKVIADFPKDLPLPRMPILENENIRYIDLNEEFKINAVRIGKHIKNGIITEHDTYLPINKFPQDLAIFGKSGTGKTYFLVHLIQEFYLKGKKVGILILNVGKASQDIYYKNFNIVKYSDKNFHIPYFVNGKEHTTEKYLQETASYICASLGLKNVFENIIYRCEVGWMTTEQKLPESFITLLLSVENYLNNNQYGPEEQANIIQIFRNRMNVFKEKKILNVLKLSDELPEWVSDWLKGGKIFLDLSMCSKFIKLLIVNAIFQLVRAVTRDIEAEELKYLIVIDEAHAILEKPITTNSDDADFIIKEQMAKIFSGLLKEYRSRGVGFIIADQAPASLFDDVASQPSIKVIFRVDYPNNTLFSEDAKERQMMTQLGNRIALVNSGATGEKYLIKTLDFNREKISM